MIIIIMGGILAPASQLAIVAYSGAMEDQASAKCLVPLDTFRSKFYSDRASGTRACFLLGSVALSTSEDVVPRRAITLTDDDRRVLANLALPPDHWSDLEVILARNRHDERVTITGQEISATGNELSCEYVLKKLGDFFRNAVDKDGGIAIIQLAIA